MSPSITITSPPQFILYKEFAGQRTTYFRIKEINASSVVFVRKTFKMSESEVNKNFGVELDTRNWRCKK